MKRISPKTIAMGASALLVLISASAVSYAQHSCNYETSLADRFRTGYNANVQWPRIYIPPARRSVCAAYDAMINNGWRRQNLLGAYHFDQNTNELTDAGKLKVNWILSQAPVQRRNVFVQRGSEELQTAARIASVHDYAGNMSPNVGQVDVNDTHIVAEGHSAKEQNALFVRFWDRSPPPVPSILPESGGGGGGGEEQ